MTTTTPHYDARAIRIVAQREEMRKIPFSPKKKDRDELATRQYFLGVALLDRGPTFRDEFVEGFELVRSAHENRNAFAGEYLRCLAKDAPESFDVVSEIGDERRKLVESLVANGRRATDGERQLSNDAQKTSSPSSAR